VTAFNLLLEDKERRLVDYAERIADLSDVSMLDAEIERLQAECSATLENIQACITENAHMVQDQEAYVRRYEELAAKYKSTKARQDVLCAQRQDKLVQAEKARLLREVIREAEPLQAFDARLWCASVGAIVVGSEHISVIFMGDDEIQVSLKGDSVQ